MIRNLIFDWSGTLADDLSAVLVATNGVLAEYDRPPLTRDEFRAAFRLPYTEFYREFLPDVPLEELKAQYLKHFPRESDAVPLLAHAREFLQYAASTGRRMVVFSSAPSEHVQAQARAGQVYDFFDAIYGGILDKREAVHALIESHGFKAAETAFIGDMRHDIDAGKAAGVLAVAVATGYESIATLMESSPDVLLPDLSRLPQLLGAAPVSESSGGHPAPPVATVGALILNRHGEVLLLKTHKWSHRWGIPGGKIKGGETCLEGLEREILEETALSLTDIQFVMIQDCIEPPEFMRSAHFLLLNYLARCTADEPQVVLNDEAEEFRWVPWSEAFGYDLNIPTRVLMDEVVRTGLL